MRFVCDEMRHLICEPYSVEGLHQMAKGLGIKRCWFHNTKYAHYDIPVRCIEEIQFKRNLVEPRELLLIIKKQMKLNDIQVS